MKRITAVFAAVMLWVATLATIPLTGCTPSVTALANDAKDVGQVALQIAAASQTLYPQISADLTIAANDLIAGANALLSGTTTESKILALVDAVDIILARFPDATVQAIAVFLPIVIAAITAIYDNFGTPAKTGAVAARAMTANVTRVKAYSPAKIKHRFGRSVEGDIRATWNDTVAQYPNAGMKAL